MNEKLLNELKFRLNQDTAIYKDWQNGNWYMTPFTHRQFIGNLERMREIIKELENEPISV